MKIDPQPDQPSLRSTVPLVTVLIVTYQSSATIGKTLEPLREQCQQGQLRCVVVDNASTDGTVELLRRESGWLKLIEGKANVGYGPGCNLGWPLATTPYVLFLNPDAILEPTALCILVDFMEQHPRAGIVAPALLGRSGRPHGAGAVATPRRIIRAALGLALEVGDRFEPGSAPFRTNWLSGAVQLVRTQLLQELKGFDPRFFMYFEETDLGVRALEAGWELWAVGEAVGQHLVAASARASGRKLIGHDIAEFFFRSRFYYLVKHHGWYSAVAAESMDLLGAALRGGAFWAIGRDPSRQFARLRAPAFRFPDPPKPPRLSGAVEGESNSLVSIRNATEADEPEIVELLSKAFGGWPQFEIPVAPIEHLHWKVRSDPIASRHQWVGEIDGRIVGTILRVVRRVRLRGRDRLARDGVDAAVDPQYESQRVYSSILDYVRDCPQASDFELGFWYSTNPRTRRRSRLGESKALGNPIQVLQKPCQVSTIVARRRERYGGRVPAPLVALRIKAEAAVNRLRHPPYRRPAEGGWSIVTLERFDDRLGEFFDEAARSFDYLIVRHKDYMNWRYGDPAGGRFTVRAAVEQGRLLGYLIFKVAEGEGYIADLLVLPGRLDVVRSLVEDALRVFREEDVELVTCWMISRHPYNGILRRYGFIDTRRDVGFKFRTVSLDEGELEFLADERARIHLTHGDTDWV